jgi:hypothetical protein
MEQHELLFSLTEGPWQNHERHRPPISDEICFLLPQLSMAPKPPAPQAVSSGLYRAMMLIGTKSPVALANVSRQLHQIGMQRFSQSETRRNKMHHKMNLQAQGNPSLKFGPLTT